MWDWGAYAAGIATAAIVEPIVQALVIPRFTVWYLENRLPSILDNMGENQKLKDAANRFVGKLMSGGAVTAAMQKITPKQAVNMALGVALPALMQRLANWIQNPANLKPREIQAMQGHTIQASFRTEPVEGVSVSAEVKK